MKKLHGFRPDFGRFPQRIFFITLYEHSGNGGRGFSELQKVEYLALDDAERPEFLGSNG